MGNEMRNQQSRYEPWTAAWETRNRTGRVPSASPKTEGLDEAMAESGTSKLPTVLIANESPESRALICGMISDLVSGVLEAEDGCEAVDICQNQKPDWAILDLSLQLIDGITVMRMVKFSDPEVKVVVVTEHDTPAFREVARMHGARGYILKTEAWKLRPLIDPDASPEPPLPPGVSPRKDSRLSVA
jgi:CheY-like chemotaxis protein